MVQIGNEINGGLLWPDGRWDNWDGLAALLTAGNNGGQGGVAATKVVLHLAEGGNNGGHRWWFDNALVAGRPVRRHRACPTTCYWHGTLGELQANLFDLGARYGKPVMVTETAYGFTTARERSPGEHLQRRRSRRWAGIRRRRRGRREAIRDMFTMVAAVPTGALGVFYWEPTWTAVEGGGWDPADPTSGDGWENQALFDYAGRALPALRVFDRF